MKRRKKKDDVEQDEEKTEIKTENKFEKAPEEVQILPVKEPENFVKPKVQMHPFIPNPYDQELLLVIGSIRSGKCLYEYSLVETEKGNKYIKNIKIGDKVLSDVGFVEVDKVFERGKKICFKIILENNNELILTDEHKIHTLNGMKQLKECDNETIITKTGKSKIISKLLYGEVECYDISVKNDNHRFYCNNISVSNSTLIANFLHQKALWGDVFGDNVTIISNTIKNCATSRFNLERWGDNCYELYDDSVIHNLVKSQEEKKKTGHDEGFCLLLDDICGSISANSNSKKGRAVVDFSTRFRHYTTRGNPVAIILSNQKFNDISTIMRVNATGVLISSAVKNKKELLSLEAEYADCVGGSENWNSMIRRNQENPYSWLYLRMSRSPCEVYLNFKERLF